jgi:hypothetical protein
MALQANHWRRNGQVNRRLEQASERPPWITRGTEREGPESRAAVVLIQEALIAAGCSIPDGPIGIFGNQTAAAVRVLQADRRNNLRPYSGIVGKDVLAALDRIMLAAEPTQAEPVRPYRLSPEQYAALIAEIRSRYSDSPLRIEEGDVLSTLIDADYPGLVGINPLLVYAQQALTYQAIVQTYIPADWFAPHRLESWRDVVRAEEFQRSLIPAEEILADLDTLRTSPIAALVFIDQSARGVERREAMAWARAAGQAASLLLLSRRGMVATSRAISGNTGQPRDSGRLRAEREAAVDAASPHPQGQLVRLPNRIPGSRPPLQRHGPARNANRLSPTPPERLFGLQPAQVRRQLTERYRRNPTSRRQ